MLPLRVRRRLLSATSAADHQADLLLQPSGQSLGRQLRSLSSARIRYVPAKVPIQRWHVTCHSLPFYSVCNFTQHKMSIQKIKRWPFYLTQSLAFYSSSYCPQPAVHGDHMDSVFCLGSKVFLTRQFAEQKNNFFARLIRLMSSCASSADGRESTVEGCLPLSHQSGPCQACKALQNNQMCLGWKGPRNTRVFIFCRLHNSGSQPCVITPILREKPY